MIPREKFGTVLKGIRNSRKDFHQYSFTNIEEYNSFFSDFLNKSFRNSLLRFV